MINIYIYISSLRALHFYFLKEKATVCKYAMETITLARTHMNGLLSLYAARSANRLQASTHMHEAITTDLGVANENTEEKKSILCNGDNIYIFNI